MREDFARGGRAAPSETDYAIGADEVNRALYDEAAGAVEGSHLLAGVHQQRERQLVLARELRVARGLLRIDAEDEGVLSLGVRPALAEFANLLRADAGVVTGIENQNDVVAAQGRERNELTILIGQREIRRGSAYRKRIGKEPVEQVSL